MSWGAKAFYMLLEDLGYQTSRIFNPDEPGKNDMIVVLGKIPEAQEESILRWVREGHLALFALPLYDEKGLCEESKLGSIVIKRKGRFAFSSKTLEKPPLGSIHGDLRIRASSCAMKVPDGGKALATQGAGAGAASGRGAGGGRKGRPRRAVAEAPNENEKAVAMELTVGEGKLLVVAHDDLLVNTNLNRDDMVVLVRRWMFNNAPARGRVAFLEERGGGGMGVIKMLSAAGLSAFLIHALVWLLLLYWSKGPRFGDPTPVFAETRREFSQHARALGHLYQHRRASSHALQQQYERFLDRLLGRPDMSQLQLGFAAGSAASRAKLRQNRAALAALIATRTGRDPASIESLLAQVEYTIGSPGPSDPKDVQRNFRLSQALAELQHTTAGRTSGDRRGRTKIRRGN
jgi:hypothetical protein